MLALGARTLLTAAACTRPLIRASTRPLVVASASGGSPLPPHLLDLVEELQSGEAQLFDVREPQEAAAGKLKLSKLVPLSDLQEGMMPPHDPALLTYLHCAAGVRVHPAAAILQEMGFERVVPMQEGFGTLYQLGFELE